LHGETPVVSECKIGFTNHHALLFAGMHHPSSKRRENSFPAISAPKHVLVSGSRNPKNPGLMI